MSSKNRILISVSIPPKVLERIDAAREYHARSAWIVEAAEEKLERVEGNGKPTPD